MTFPFGKYKGRRLGDLPPDYVEWVRKSVPLFPRLCDQMEQVWGGSFRCKLEPDSRQERPAESSQLSAIDFKSLRRRFAARFHPDRPGGSLDAMQAVNVIFDELETVA